MSDFASFVSGQTELDTLGLKALKLKRRRPHITAQPTMAGVKQSLANLRIELVRVRDPERL